MAWGLRACGLRNAAGPFDWLSCQAEAVVDCILEDFARFLIDPERADGHSEKSCIKDSYTFQFRHDFPTVTGESSDYTEEGQKFVEKYVADGWEDHLHNVRCKYARRIERMRQSLASGGLVVFVKYGFMRYETALRLLDGMQARFPQTDIRMIAANSGMISEQQQRIYTSTLIGDEWEGKSWLDILARAKHAWGIT